MLPDDDDPIVFVGGKDYLPLFGKLSAPLRARKVVFFNSRTEPDLPQGFKAIRYTTATRTNWHYECARDLSAGTLEESFA
jgi:hypothetical protein